MFHQSGKVEFLDRLRMDAEKVIKAIVHTPTVVSNMNRSKAYKCVKARLESLSDQTYDDCFDWRDFPKQLEKSA